MRDSNRKAKIAALQNSAVRLFLEKGIQGVSVDDIVRAAGVGKGSFYFYFDDTTALVRGMFAEPTATVDHAFAECERALTSASLPEERVSACMALGAPLVAAYQNNPDLVRLYLQESRAPGVGARAPIVELAHRIDQGAMALTHAVKSEGPLAPIPARWRALAIVGAVERLLFETLSGEPLGDASKIFEAFASVLQ